jgi:hypothetical protein
MRYYAGTASAGDEALLREQVKGFLAFAEGQINGINETPSQLLQGSPQTQRP